MTSSPFIAMRQLDHLGHTVVQVSPVAASLLLASIWRGALLALVVYLGFRCAPKLPAAIRSAVWMCVLLLVVPSPALPLFFPSSASTALGTGLVHADVRWSYALLAGWAVVSGLRLAQLAVSAIQLRGLAHRAIAMTPSEGVAAILRSTRRSVELCVTPEIDRPSVAGFLRPRILLPPELLAKISEGELQQVVLHEMEHLRRRDDWTNLLQKLSIALLPLHPVVIWLDRRLCIERELACDDGVVRATQARRSYAACLAHLAEHSLMQRGVSLALSAVGSWKPKSAVAKRVCRILAKPEAAMGRTQARFAASTIVAGVIGAAVVLAHTPHLVTFMPAVAEEATVEPTSPAMQASPQRQLSENIAGASSTMSFAPRAVFASASMPGNAPLRATPASLPLHTRRKAAIKRAEQRVKDQRPQSDPLFRLAAWHDDGMSAPRFALAIQEDSQFTYAAVPVRGGWLIVQL